MLCPSKETKVRKEKRTGNFPDSGPSRTKTVISFNAALRKYWSHENIALMDDEMGEEDDRIEGKICKIRMGSEKTALCVKEVLHRLHITDFSNPYNLKWK